MVPAVVAPASEAGSFPNVLSFSLDNRSGMLYARLCYPFWTKQVLSLLSHRSNLRIFKSLRTLLRHSRALTSPLSVTSELFLS